MKITDLKINNLYLCFSDGEFSFDGEKKFTEYGADDNNEIELNKVAKCLSRDLEMDNAVISSVLQLQDPEKKGKINLDQFLKALDVINDMLPDSISSESETNESSKQ